MKVYIRKLRILHASSRSRNDSGWLLSNPDSVDQHMVQLETEGDSPLQRDDNSTTGGVVATRRTAANGLFDMEYTDDVPSIVWGMYVTTREGLLLLEQNLEPTKPVPYKRLDVFTVEDLYAFFPQESIEKAFLYDAVVIGSLPMKTVVLV